jgi:hypothetical protein
VYLADDENSMALAISLSDKVLYFGVVWPSAAKRREYQAYLKLQNQCMSSITILK